MTTENFHDVRRRVIARHAAGDYAGALEIARAAGREYPEAADRTTYWIACLLSRLGEVERALKALEEDPAAGCGGDPQRSKPTPISNRSMTMPASRPSWRPGDAPTQPHGLVHRGIRS